MRRKDVSSLSVDVQNGKTTPVFCLVTVASMHKQQSIGKINQTKVERPKNA